MRYVRLYINFLRFSFSKASEFRMDFFFRIIMDTIYYVVNLLFYRVIYLHTDILGGWNEFDAMVFVGGYLFVDALIMTFVSNNLWWIPMFVNRGDLDYYLIRPVSSLFFLSFREFSVNSSMNLIMSISILSWAIWRYPGDIENYQIVLFVLLLFAGAFLYYLLRILSIVPVFWTISGRGFDNLFWQMARFMERPDRIFQGWFRKVLLSILPFGLMASYPARIFLGDMDWIVIGHILGVIGIFYFFVMWLWRIGLRSYSSASS